MATKDEEFLAQLLEAFRIEAGEHLQAMSSGLLELEKMPQGAAQTPLIEAIYREAHSLKGAARAVNVTAVETVCQALESVFSGWKRQEIQPSSAQFDVLYQALDVVGKLLAAPQGVAGAQLSQLVQRIADIKEKAPGGDVRGAASPSVEALSKSAESPPSREVSGRDVSPELGHTNGKARPSFSPTPPAAPPAAPPVAPPAAEAKPEAKPTETKPTEAKPDGAKPDGAKPPATEKTAMPETVRISTAKLDGLLLQAEEMLVVKLTAGQRAADLREVESLCDLWAKEWAKVSPEFRGARRLFEKGNGQSAGQGNGQQSVASGRLLDFLDWNQSYIKSLENKLAALARAAEHDQRAVGGMVDNLLEDTKKLLMLPFATLFSIFPKLIRDLSHDQGKDVQLVMRGSEVEIDKRILEEMKDPLIHLLRNCVDHGIEAPEERAQKGKPRRATVALAVSQVGGNEVEILITDDGGGMDLAEIKAAAVRHGLLDEDEVDKLGEAQALSLIFQSGVSTSPIITEISGRGLGMTIVREKVEKLGGRIGVETKPDAGTTFRILLPLTLATFKGILVEAAGQVFVIPTANVERVVRIQGDDVKTVENRETIPLSRAPSGQDVVALVRLDDVLELSRANEEDAGLVQVVVLGSGEKRIAFRVDAVLNEQEVLVKSLGAPLARVRNVAGATVLGSGKAVPILNAADLLKSALRISGASARAAAGEAQAKGRAVLIVEDSITSRMLLKNILESAGYQVTTAVDGMDALTSLKTNEFDVVVSDVDMPRLDGFGLTEAIRGDKRLEEMPVVLVTGRESREDRERGIDVGANAYIVKSSFDQSNLLDVLRRLV